MATVTSPGSFSQTQGTVGQSYVFAAEDIREEITERLDVLGLGIVQGIGDLQGTGSDTIRVTRYGGVGFAEAMTAMASETDPISPTGWTLGNDTLTIGRYGMAKEQTYQDQILSRSATIGLGELKSMVPMSWLATLRSLTATAGSTFASGYGTSGAAWTFDDELELIAGFRETEGFDSAMGVVSLRHPEQYTDLVNSIRNEPGLQFPEIVERLMGIGASGADGAIQFLGIRNFGSWDVPTSGGDHVGCAYVPGALVFGVASTTPVRVQNPELAMYIPDYGLLIEEKSSGGVATGRYNANAWLGVAKISATLAPQFKITSVND